MGADMAIQFMLGTLFQLVSERADDPRGSVRMFIGNLLISWRPISCHRCRKMLTERFELPLAGFSTAS
ncbi:hypothetical protein CP49_23450 [Bradyrhizobium valentinum]|uniref:Uncharacterized protein n=1 Tax=Bradyrhizobium valentinum TaxID=1518501 RepID=A0A0R3M5R3_9BRAD|nr:hypothetical protein CP49_23450 [Bradyrhizobium valentinum]